MKYMQPTEKQIIQLGNWWDCEKCLNGRSMKNICQIGQSQKERLDDSWSRPAHDSTTRTREAHIYECSIHYSCVWMKSVWRCGKVCCESNVWPPWLDRALADSINSTIVWIRGEEYDGNNNSIFCWPIMTLFPSVCHYGMLLQALVRR